MRLPIVQNKRMLRLITKDRIEGVEPSLQEPLGVSDNTL